MGEGENGKEYKKIIWSLHFAILHTFFEEFKYKQVILKLDLPQFQGVNIQHKFSFSFSEYSKI